GALVQLCFYSDMLGRLQGTQPRLVHVVLGGLAEPEHFPVNHYSAYFRKVRNDFARAWQAEPSTYPEPVDHCDVCSWYPLCDERRRADDHLSLVAGISRNQRKALVARRIVTVVDLARLALPVTPKFERIGTAALQRIREQARIQVQGREEKRLLYELLDEFEPGRGLACLPTPDPADIFLDFESNPYVFGDGLEYLTGFVTLDGHGQPQYQAMWALD